MKNILFLIVIIFNGMLVQAQTDLEIAEAIIEKPFFELESILDTFEIDYYIVSVEDEKITVYIQRQDNIKKWTLRYGNICEKQKTSFGHYQDVAIKTDVIVEVYVRYRHSNLNDLRDFYSYNIPENTQFREHEKSLGIDMSHLKIILNNSK